MPGMPPEPPADDEVPPAPDAPPVADATSEFRASLLPASDVTLPSSTSPQAAMANTKMLFRRTPCMKPPRTRFASLAPTRMRANLALACSRGRGSATVDRFQKSGFDAKLETFPGVGHTVSPEMRIRLYALLRAVCARARNAPSAH